MPGYPLPDGPLTTAETICVSFVWPNLPAYRRALWGQLAALGKWYTWQQDAEHRATDAAMFLKPFIAAAIGNWTEDCEDMPNDFRQTGCVLEYSKDAGLTWATAFNYALCFPTLSGIAFASTVGPTLEAMRHYDDPRDAGGNAPRDTFSSDQDDQPGDSDLREAVLCRVLHDLVKINGQALLKRAQEQLTPLNFVEIAATIAAAVISVFGGPAWWVFSAALVQAAAMAAMPVLTAIDQAVVSDQEAIDELACCALEEIRDLAVTEANFAAMFDNCSPANANAQKMIGGMRAIVSDPASRREAYYSFLGLLSDGFGIAKLDTSVFSGCGCVMCSPTITSGYTIEQGTEVSPGVFAGADGPGDYDGVRIVVPVGGRLARIKFEWKQQGGAWPLLYVGGSATQPFDQGAIAVWYRDNYSRNDWAAEFIDIPIENRTNLTDVRLFAWSRYGCDLRNVQVCLEI